MTLFTKRAPANFSVFGSPQWSVTERIILNFGVNYSFKIWLASKVFEIILYYYLQKLNLFHYTFTLTIPYSQYLIFEEMLSAVELH